MRRENIFGIQSQALRHFSQKSLRLLLRDLVVIRLIGKQLAITPYRFAILAPEQVE